MTLRLVLHAPTPGSLARARSNARNLLAADPDATVEIVVNATAATAALSEPDPATDPLLCLCENALRAQGLDGAGHRTVPAAILHLARRQAAGWAYVRA